MGIIDKVKKEKKAPAKKTVKKEAEVKTEKAPVKLGAASAGAMLTVIKPLVTEKAAHMQSDQTYAFVVRASANKFEIGEAIKQIYGVQPRSVRVINVQGHRVRSGKFAGKRSDFKKAMVTLKPGDSITIHEGV